MKNAIIGALLSVVTPVLVSGCSAFTSITREDNDTYAITGWESPGSRGFVWICTYDPVTKTLTVIEAY
jgi:hypothetical protein